MKYSLKEISKKTNLLVSDTLELLNIIKELENSILEISRKLGEMASEAWEIYKSDEPEK